MAQQTAYPLPPGILATPEKKTYRLRGHNVQTETRLCGSSKEAWEKLRVKLPLCFVVMEVLCTVEVPVNGGGATLERLQLFYPAHVGKFNRTQEFWFPVYTGFTKDEYKEDDGVPMPEPRPKRTPEADEIPDPNRVITPKEAEAAAALSAKFRS